MSPEEEERALNAAAAREVSRELDSLTFSPPVPLDSNFISDRGRTPPPLQDRADFSSPAYRSTSRDASPRPYRQGDFNQDARAQPSEPPRLQISSPSSPGQASPTGPRSPISPGGSKIESPLRIAMPTIGLSQPETWSTTSINSSNGGTPSVYRTPPENPRGLGTSPLIPSAINKSPLSSPMASPLPPPAPGGRTISAAAFKRPQPRLSGDVMGADTSPLALGKRSLPSSPYPQRQRSISTDNTNPTQPPSRLFDSAAPPRDRAVSNPPFQHQQDISTTTTEDDEQFDYIAAYVNSIGNSDPGEPIATTPARSGYGQGKFATDLESEIR
jgi:hypothetical protein